MSSAVLIILYLLALAWSQDGKRAMSFLIYVLEYTVHTVQLYWGRKEAPTSASETLGTDIHTRCGYTELHMSNHLSTDVYLQMVRVRRVCASLLILFAFASLSVYRSLTAVGILHIRAVSHQGVTYGSLSVCPVCPEPVCLVIEPGPITTGIQVHVHLFKKGPRGRATRMPRQRLLTGFDHFVSCVSGSSGDAWPSCLGVIFGDRSWIYARRQVSQILPNLRFTPKHTIQASKEETVASTCRQTKNKSSCMSPKLGASCTDGWRSPQLRECTNRWAFKTPFFINSITPQLPSPFPPCLISPPPWAKVIICSFIKLDNIPCVVGACTQESRPTVLACSILYYWRIISRMPSSFIKHFWSNVNRLENWDIYEVWAVFMKKSIKYDRGEVR